ncbi:hypothetical protein GMB86_10605 [Terrilactibacillus sp. BCM23-1]|uniref:Zn-ribbon containing protein n=1 Tax=Terrilactibacillus tamarindi TaxID=2599694 RepID=A0A6N8CTX7_9BACI|nr:hypothetical protein [Terrilactibacillus tamarindi]MTT32455.1 hypothetical protein [Terrilactibacillus tamarindi]
MKCPNCSSSNLGKIGMNQYYCWNCFIELTLVEGNLSLNQVEEDGSLTTLNDLFDENQLKAENNGF